MNELQKTVIFCLAAAVLAGAAMIVDPGSATPAVFDDQGEIFFADFTDPQAPKAIEVIDYDAESASATTLKVENVDNKWVLPSHGFYPADAEDRLANTAAALIELRKDIVISDRVEDHEQFDVIDPLDEKATSLTGRGKRVTLRDGEGAVLADFVIGSKVEDKAGYRYMRVWPQRRIYAVKTDIDPSVEFTDWIETDLLKLSPADVRKVQINSYSINERLGRVENTDRFALTKKDDEWSMPGGKPNKDNVDALTKALDELKIVSVEEKPEGLSQDLKAETGIQLTRESFESLRQRGFFINTATGQLLSNEGEIVVDAANGLQYTLRFGEIVTGGPAAEQEGEEAGEGERRYLFITVNYSEERAKQYGVDGKVDEKGKELAEELTNRFADWYYVIPGKDFSSLRPSRRELRG